VKLSSERVVGRAGLTVSELAPALGVVAELELLEPGDVEDEAVPLVPEPPQPARPAAKRSATAEAAETRMRVWRGSSTIPRRVEPVRCNPEAVDQSTTIAPMDPVVDARLEGVALEAWRSYLQSHAAIVRELDADLAAGHGLTTRDYEVLLYLAQAEEGRLPMSALAERTMLTRSGITRLIDGLVASGLIQRVACPADARISYAQLTDAGHEKLRRAGCSHVASINRLFAERFSYEELATLAELLGRLPGAHFDGACSLARTQRRAIGAARRYS
jgi:DNA-binding MarR family transcriptional regulator